LLIAPAEAVIFEETDADAHNVASPDGTAAIAVESTRKIETGLLKRIEAISGPEGVVFEVERIALEDGFA